MLITLIRRRPVSKLPSNYKICRIEGGCQFRPLDTTVLREVQTERDHLR